jgi:4-amino-4-deoxy-L-arabinose transferase-like glycosyltransferase
MFSVCYALAAVGTLTKSLPAIAFIGFSVLALLFYHKDLKRLFSGAHFLGIAIYLLITGVYFYIHVQHNPFGVEGYMSDMWKDSSERTVLERGYSKLFVHLLSFPFEVLKNILPAGLLVVFAFRKDFMKKIKENRFAQFSFYFLIFNLPLYYISPGARSRYTYMFFPFLVFIFTYFYFEVKGDKTKWEKALRIVANVLCILVPIAAIVLIFIPQGKFIEGLWWQMSAVAAMGMLIAFWHFNRKFHFMLTFVMLIALARIGFDLTVLPYKSVYSSQKSDMEDARVMSKITNSQNVKLYKATQLSLTTIYYFQVFNDKILHVTDDAVSGDWVILDKKYAPELSYESEYEFKFREDEMMLVKVK